MNDILESSRAMVDQTSCREQTRDDCEAQEDQKSGGRDERGNLRKGSRMYERAGISSTVDMFATYLSGRSELALDFDERVVKSSS